MNSAVLHPQHLSRTCRTLTVTNVAADLEVTMDEAERGLTALDDSTGVTSTVTENGVIVYEFKEVMHRQARLNAAGTPRA